MSRLAFAACLALAAPAFADARFFTEIPDLPLPPGFTQAAAGVSFEGERGRIVTAEAQGAGEMLAVRDFYEETLPQLGWGTSVENDALVFVRGRERLHFFIERIEGGRISLRAQLVIAPASMD